MKCREPVAKHDLAIFGVLAIGGIGNRRGTVRVGEGWNGACIKHLSCDWGTMFDSHTFSIGHSLADFCERS